MTETPQAAAGWYPDGTGQLRYYDGSAWTDHVHLAGDEAPVAAEVAVTHHTHAAAKVPLHRRPWLIAVVAFGAVLGAGAAVLVIGGDDVGGGVAGSSTTATPASVTTPQPVSPASPVTYGAAPTVVAAAAACIDVRNAQEAEAASPVKYRRVTCTLSGATVEVDTYPAAADQAIAEAALVGFIGTGKYASGEGWLAVDEKFGATTAQVFADALGGTVKGA